MTGPVALDHRPSSGFGQTGSRSATPDPHRPGNPVMDIHRYPVSRPRQPRRTPLRSVVDPMIGFGAVSVRLHGAAREGARVTGCGSLEKRE